MGKHLRRVVSHLQGKNRLRLVHQHRMEQFEKSFDMLLKGQCSPEYVKERADKIKATN